MSQFDNTTPPPPPGFPQEPNDFQTYQTERTWSGLGVTGFICSLIVCCPVITLVGVVLSAIALPATGAHKRKGRGLAIAGIIIGLITTAIGAGGAFWLYKVSIEFVNVPNRVMPILQGDTDNFAAISNDLRVFTTDEFDSAVSDGVLNKWMQSVREKHGKLAGFQAEQQQTQQISQTKTSISFTGKFVKGPAVITIVILMDQQAIFTDIANALKLDDIKVDGFSPRDIAKEETGSKKDERVDKNGGDTEKPSSPKEP